MNSCPLIPADWELPTVLRIRLGHGPGRQRVLEADDHLLLVLHEISPKSALAVMLVVGLLLGSGLTY